MVSNYILDSERSDEYIDFTMIITSRNNASNSNFGGGFRWKNEYPWCIIQVKRNIFQQFSKKSRKTKKKVMEKQEFLRKTVFDQIDFLYGIIHKNLCIRRELKIFYTLKRCASHYYDFMIMMIIMYSVIIYPKISPGVFDIDVVCLEALRLTMYFFTLNLYIVLVRFYTARMLCGRCGFYTRSPHHFRSYDAIGYLGRLCDLRVCYRCIRIGSGVVTKGYNQKNLPAFH
ncbi:hypothetical protein AGLY_002159 [Aphis glycines]|uniref:Uncharacterized protein n=1 Tax=Aphis glycines TaxID=307491 RepID=A0A6G0U409_APHGL|nr:hypothetical protein AGLY_002159 [Aphis glycines]